MKLILEELRFESTPYRTPLKFGDAVVDRGTLLVVKLSLLDGDRFATGVGAMVLGNAWSFPQVPFNLSMAVMRELGQQIANHLPAQAPSSSVFELSHELEARTLDLARELSQTFAGLSVPIPKLCSLVVFSAFDIALFDAWGKLNHSNTFELLQQTPEAHDLSRWLDQDFRQFGLQQTLSAAPVASLPMFHLVGGLDPLSPTEVRNPVNDGLPEHLQAWISKDELTHLKIKLRGDDPAWDYQRIVSVDRVASDSVAGEPVYSLDFNEKCESAEVLVDLLQRLNTDASVAFRRIAYIEQPTSRDLLDRPQDRMHAAAKLKPVVIDEALTDYAAFKRAREMGYSGVALKACKGIAHSLLMAAACRKNNLFLCVQDLTCPGLALLASASLAAWLGVEAIEANARQFCPSANDAMRLRRPEVFNVRRGCIHTGGFTTPGLGFEVDTPKQ